jgi:hypothetical protein
MFGTASWAQSASVAVSASFAPTQAGVISSSAQFTSLTAPFTGSFTGSFIGSIQATDVLGNTLTQTSSSIGIGDYFYDTGVTVTSLVPTGPAVYELLTQYNPNSAGSGNYRNIIHGNIYINGGYDGAQVVVTVQYNELFRSVGSGSYDGAGSNVNVSFVNTTNALPATERVTVPFASGSWQMRIRFSENSTPPAIVEYRSVRLLRKL